MAGRGSLNPAVEVRVLPSEPRFFKPLWCSWRDTLPWYGRERGSIPRRGSGSTTSSSRHLRPWPSSRHTVATRNTPVQIRAGAPYGSFDGTGWGLLNPKAGFDSPMSFYALPKERTRAS